jgi:hypothetical protein
MTKMDSKNFWIMGIITMSIFYNNSLSTGGHQKVLADFLNQLVDAIACQILSGGSEEGNLAKCTYDGTDYVVKFFGDPTFGANEILWTRHASELGIGSHVYYTDSAGSYMITEFVQGNSLVPTTANTPVVIQGVATCLSKLHNSSLPAARVSDLFARIETKYKKLQCSGQLKNMVDSGMMYVGGAKDRWQSHKVPSVPCHNDLNWGNIFVDGNRVTLIDWGDAALGNPYYDIAAFLVLNVLNPQAEKLFFERYDPQLLEPAWQEYMHACKQLVYLEFALNLLLGVQTGNSTLLHAEYNSLPDGIDSYLSRLAARNVEVNSAFLYEMAIASLNRMLEMTL